MRTPGRSKGEARGVAGKVAGQQQVALGIVAVEHGPFGQPLKVGGDELFGIAGVAANPDLGQLGERDVEAQAPLGNALLGHLHGNNIAGLAQQGRRAVAHVAHDGNLVLASDKVGIGRADETAVDGVETREGDIAQGEADVGEFGIVERARFAFQAALNLDPRARRGGRRGPPFELLAGRRERTGLRHGRRWPGGRRCQPVADGVPRGTTLSAVDMRNASLHVGPPFPDAPAESARALSSH